MKMKRYMQDFNWIYTHMFKKYFAIYLHDLGIISRDSLITWMAKSMNSIIYCKDRGGIGTYK